ncbi:MAG TPA: heavy metal-binding domain-containing protein [Ktedonobacteraceae bacterium]|jgi:uncharacterized protein YbjQ (UPF0145 family)
MDKPRYVMDVQPGYRGQAFTSDLTGQEFWLVLDKGFQPLGLVMGNCVYSMGALHHLVTQAKGTLRGELKEYSEAMYEARGLALARMQFEADQLGADGIIGIDLKIEFLHDNEWMEVVATGTAVRHIRGTHNIPPTGQGRVVIPTN